MSVQEITVQRGWGPAELSEICKPESVERDAAWELYVDLVTPIAVVPLQPGEGILRGALSSLPTLFGITRGIMCRYGPAVARPARGGWVRFAYIAVSAATPVSVWGRRRSGRCYSGRSTACGSLRLRLELAGGADG